MWSTKPQNITYSDSLSQKDHCFLRIKPFALNRSLIIKNFLLSCKMWITLITYGRLITEVKAPKLCTKIFNQALPIITCCPIPVFLQKNVMGNLSWILALRFLEKNLKEICFQYIAMVSPLKRACIYSCTNLKVPHLRLFYIKFGLNWSYW